MMVALYVLAAVAAFALGAWWASARAAAKAPPGRRRRKKRPPKARVPAEPLPEVPRFQFEDDDDLEITKVTVITHDGETLRIEALTDDATQRIERRPEDDTKRFERGVVPIIVDDEAGEELPTSVSAYILLSAGGQTDPGRKRRSNEDYFAIVDDPPVYLVADGMGGHAGGALASAMAVETIVAAFAKGMFDDELYEGLPRRGRELVQAVQLANRRIYDKARAKEELEGMGTTVICARFSARKERVYIGHVGDSRCYRVRDGEIHQLTADHNVAAHGFTGPMASHLTRALGIAPSVVVDLMIGKPKPGDRYVLCSDGLSKMIDDDTIRDAILAHDEPKDAVARLVALANEAGGRDNTTVIAVYVTPVR